MRWRESKDAAQFSCPIQPRPLAHTGPAQLQRGSPATQDMGSSGKLPGAPARLAFSKGTGYLLNCFLRKSQKPLPPPQQSVFSHVYPVL